MSDELRRRLARAAGDGDLVAAQHLVALLERVQRGEQIRPRVAFVCKDDRGSFIWGTTSRSPADAEQRYRMRVHPFSAYTIPEIVRIRVFEDPAPKASPSPAIRSVPMASPSASSSSEGAPS